MGKFTRKLGLGLALGALAGHYLSTDKGQQLLAKVKKGLAAYQEDPVYYQEQAKTFIAEQVAYVKEVVKEEFSEPAETNAPAAEVDDIIITYTEDEA